MLRALQVPRDEGLLDFRAAGGGGGHRVRGAVVEKARELVLCAGRTATAWTNCPRSSRVFARRLQANELGQAPTVP